MPSFADEFHTHLTELLQSLPSVKRFYVAYSGGLDSQVLLHLMWTFQKKQTQYELCAVHVHHGLHCDASEWQAHCERFCRRLSIPFEHFHVDARPSVGESPEAKARAMRYHILSSRITQDAVLMTAHHQDDQIETFFLQLFRGSGLKGLAGMSACTPFAKGHLLRPLLNFSRERLLVYANKHQFEWIEDPSNHDVNFSRNYLRHEILPLLQKRWPGLSRTVTRTMRYCKEMRRRLDSEMKTLFEHCLTEDPAVLSMVALNKHDHQTQSEIIRQWLQYLKLPTPQKTHMDQILKTVVQSRDDAMPCVYFSGVVIRRFQQKLYVSRYSDVVREKQDFHLLWEGQTELELPGCSLRFVVRQQQGQGICREALTASPVFISSRRCGKSVKKRFQELSIPPWERSSIPFLYQGDRLVSIIGYWIDPRFRVASDKTGYVFECVVNSV